MTEIRINPNVSTDAVQQANLLTALNTLDPKTELSPLLSRSANVTVSNAPMDLDALVAKLNDETANSNEATAKKKLNSVLSTVIAYAKANAEISESNMAALESAEQSSHQLEELNATIRVQTSQVKQAERAVDTAQKNVDAIQKKVDELQNEVNVLQEELETETDPTRQIELQKQLSAAETKLAAGKEKLEAAQQTLTEAKTNLQTAKEALAASNAKKTELTEAVDTALASIEDEELLRAMKELLKIDSSDVSNLMEEQKAERSEEEEKYLDKHNIVRLIHDAIANHDQEFLDTIDEKREAKI